MGSNFNSGHRQIVLFCDGTNNTLTGGLYDTNVLQLFEAMQATRTKDQILYYDPGVGTPDAVPPTDLVQWCQRQLTRLSGMASGQGVFENIGEAYSFLMEHYQPGDEIWLFGFSRGAFTARSVAGMINLFGLIRAEHRAILPTLLRVYFSSTDGSSIPMKVLQATGIGRGGKTRGDVAHQIRHVFASDEGRAVKVHFVGVWDTVESVGMPGFSLQISSSKSIRGKAVRHTRHALSLDEHRWAFLPRQFEEANFGDATSEQSLKQVWFRGVHSDVGGGYPVHESGLPSHALAWMADEAIACGLRCPPCREWPHRAHVRRVAHDPLHENTLWALIGMTVRSTEGFRDENGKLQPAVAHPSAGAGVDETVWSRRRSLTWVPIALVGAIALFLSAFMLLPGSGWQLFWDQIRTPAGWGPALEKAGAMAWAQLTSITSPTGPFEVASSLGACPRWAMLYDLVFAVCYAYVLARWCTWTFACKSGLRTVNQRAPRWLKALGGALPLLFWSDVGEDLFALAAFTIGNDTAIGPSVFWLGSWFALMKFAGLGATLLLVMFQVMPGWRVGGAMPQGPANAPLPGQQVTG